MRSTSRTIVWDDTQTGKFINSLLHAQDRFYVSTPSFNCALIFCRHYGCAPLQPCTNNAVEGINRVIKDHWIDRTKEKMEIFLPKMEDMMVYWSKRSADLGFATVPQISEKLWDDAVALLRSGDLQVMPFGNMRIVRNGKCGPPAVPHGLFAMMYFRPEENIHSFEEYACFLGSWYTIRAVGPNFLMCSCEDGMKDYKCKHALAMEINDGMAEIPARFNPQQDLPAPRGRGRPRKKADGGFGTGPSKMAKK